MVCVCPPHTSMNLYWRPGSHSSVIRAARACALSASRNSSTNRMAPPLLDPRFGEGGELVGVGLPDSLQELQRGRGLAFVDLGQGEADVDEHPLTRLRQVVREQPHVDHPPDAADVHPGQVRLVREELHHLTWYTEAHVITPSWRTRRCLLASRRAGRARGRPAPGPSPSAPPLPPPRRPARSGRSPPPRWPAHTPPPAPGPPRRRAFRSGRASRRAASHEGRRACSRSGSATSRRRPSAARAPAR